MSAARMALWIVTVFALTLFVRSVFGEPVPGWFAACALALVVGTYLIGCAFPSWEMFGDVLSIGPLEGDTVALVFFGTESLVDTDEVLQTLDDQKVKATFLLSLPSLHGTNVGTLRDKGHAIGLVSSGGALWRSVKSKGSLQQELARGVAELNQRWGVEPVAFMPATRTFGPGLFAAAKRTRLPVVYPQPVHAKERVKAGSIVSLPLDDDAAATTRTLLRTLRERKLTPVPLSAWL